MTKRAVIVVPLLLLLAGCDPTPPPAAEPTPVIEPPEAPTAQPVLPVADDYLVEHQPADAVAESSELFHYAFWTDDTKAVRCDITIGGQSDPVAGCLVMSAFESSVTYAPVATSLDCVDGFEVGIVAIPADAGYDQPRAQVSGCAEYRQYPSAAIAAATLVLPPGAALELGPFRCAVADAVATCEYPAMGASVSLGLSMIGVVN
jgi:hypothetical protein